MSPSSAPFFFEQVRVARSFAARSARYLMRADFQAYRDHEKAEAVYKPAARPVQCVLAGTLLTVMNKLLLKLQKLLSKFLHIFT